MQNWWRVRLNSLADFDFCQYLLHLFSHFWGKSWTIGERVFVMTKAGTWGQLNFLGYIWRQPLSYFVFSPLFCIACVTFDELLPPSRYWKFTTAYILLTILLRFVMTGSDDSGVPWVVGLSVFGFLVSVPAFIIFVRWLRGQQTIGGLYAASAFITRRSSACDNRPLSNNEPSLPSPVVSSDFNAMSWSLRTFTPSPGEKEETCIICLEEFSDSMVAEMPCSHIAHAHCLQTWFKKDKSQACPICRRSFGPSSCDCSVVTDVLS